MTGLWQNRTFRLVIAASGVSGLGAGVTAIAFPWFAASLTRDPFLIGLVAAGPTLPTLLFTLAAGVLTDRLDRRRTMIFCDAARAGLTLAVAGLALSGMVGLPAVLALAVVAVGLGTALVMHDNVAQSVLPGIVDKDHLERANAALWSLEQLTAQFLGPPVAGALMGDAFTGLMWNVVTVSYRQRHIPDALLGRTNAAYRFIGTGTLPLGALAGGALVSLAAPLGPTALQLPFAVATLGGLAMLIYAALRLQLD